MPDNDQHSSPTLRIIPRDQHNVSRKDISPNALRVLYRLRDAGFGAFLVGGAVRDILVGGHPKDFDVATDATPEQVRQLFRNCRLIGRRFRLAHVVFGREIIEVATFRANVDDGSCQDLGCTDVHATNFDTASDVSDGTCIYPIAGCMDSLASNYRADANTPAACVKGGCTDVNSIAYDPSATFEDGITCVLAIEGCTTLGSGARPPRFPPTDPLTWP